MTAQTPIKYSILSAATECAAHGWHVFPVPPGSKKSHKKAEHSGGREWGATTDPAAIASDWARWPEANLGIVTGPKSGFFVVEADTMDGHEVDGVANLKALIAENGDLPHTIEAESPSGSWHIYFRYPAAAIIKNSASQIAPGVDVRGDGGMVVAPPSVKPGNPKPYRWINPPGLFDLADCPDWLLHLCVKPKPKLSEQAAAPYRIDTSGGNAWADKALAGELAALFSAPTGKRNQALNDSAFNLAQIVAGGGLSEAAVKARLSGAALAIGLEPGETAATIDSGFKAGLLTPRQPKQRQEVSSRKEFAAPVNGDQPDLICGTRGKPIWCAENACAVIETAVAWQDCLAHDEFAGLTLLMKPIPGTPVPRATFSPRPLADTDITSAVRWFNRHGFPDATKNTTADALYSVAAQNVISPVRHYLEALVWDDVRRVDGWLSSYCGAALAPLTAKVGKAWLVAAVARALKPGCKADCALVLEGKQGAGKSSALKALAGGDWFYDGLHDLQSKDASAGLRGKWIIELPELSAMRRSDVEAVKAFLSRTEERYRPAYARAEVIEPRRCVFAGTTNRNDYITDDTGGRRFWPVEVQHIRVADLERDRDQIWAEAVALFLSGEGWWLNHEAEAEAATVVRARAADDPWASDVLARVDGLSECSTRDVFQFLDIPQDRRTKADSMRIGGILTRAGWMRAGKFTTGPSRDLSRYTPPTGDV